MTTPEERRRNWLWTREMLLDLSNGGDLPGKLGEAAADLLARFPSQLQLDTTDPDGQRHLSVTHSAALDQARQLFRRVCSDVDAPNEIRHQLRVILRHLD
jgi:hypothetical protein